MNTFAHDQPLTGTAPTPSELLSGAQQPPSPAAEAGTQVGEIDLPGF